MKFKDITKKPSKSKKPIIEVPKSTKTPQLILNKGINSGYKGYEGIIGELLSIIPKELKSTIDSGSMTAIKVGADRTYILLDNSIKIFIKRLIYAGRFRKKVKIEFNGKEVLNTYI